MPLTEANKTGNLGMSNYSVSLGLITIAIGVYPPDSEVTGFILDHICTEYVGWLVTYDCL